MGYLTRPTATVRSRTLMLSAFRFDSKLQIYTGRLEPARAKAAAAQPPARASSGDEAHSKGPKSTPPGSNRAQTRFRLRTRFPTGAETSRSVKKPGGILRANHKSGREYRVSGRTRGEPVAPRGLRVKIRAALWAGLGNVGNAPKHYYRLTSARVK
jgi:hypothetical protein